MDSSIAFLVSGKVSISENVENVVDIQYSYVQFGVAYALCSATLYNT